MLSVLLLSLSVFHQQERMQALESEVEELRLQLQQSVQDELWLIGRELEEQRLEAANTAQALSSCVAVLSQPVSTAMRCYYSQLPQLHSADSMLAELDGLAADSEQLLSLDPLQPPTEADLRAQLRVRHAETPQQQTVRYRSNADSCFLRGLLSLSAHCSGHSARQRLKGSWSSSPVRRQSSSRSRSSSWSTSSTETSRTSS